MSSVIQHIIAVVACVFLAFALAVVSVCLGELATKVVDKINQFLTK